MRSFRLFLAWSFVLVTAGRAESEPSASGLRTAFDGAWQMQSEGHKRVLLVMDGYWSDTMFDVGERKFVRTVGGPVTIHSGRASGAIHFNSADAEQVGTRFEVGVRLHEDRLVVLHEDGAEEVWTRVDTGEGPLAGVWRITGRDREGVMGEMPLRPRRTLKLLTGDRFQWFAINIENGEFSGTGGGTYSFVEGRYTERLEFFSRDASRVGATLEFEGEVNDGQWHHRGRSSRGDPIYEIWSPLEPAGRD